MNLNKVTIIGNLTRDPKNRSLPAGQAITEFGLATNYMWKEAKTGEKKATTEFHDIVASGRLGEICAQYLKKGSKVYVEGRIRTRSWQDKKGGRRSKAEVIAENLIMLGHRTRPKDEDTDRAGEELAPESPDRD